MAGRPESSVLRRPLPWWPLAFAAYVASRLWYRSIGLESDYSPLDHFWQYLDPELLRTDLLRSVLYQHSQPPLYNLWLGLALKSGHAARFFAASEVVFGLALHLALYAGLRALGIRALLAVIATAAFAFSPASVLMEGWLFYEYPVAALVALSAALLHRGLVRERGPALLLAFGCMAAVALTRSLFHLAWMLAAIFLVATFARRRRRVLAIAIVPVALAASVYVKNAVLFGEPVASTWIGFSLSRLTTTEAPTNLRLRWMADGELSPLAMSLPWLPIGHYPAAAREVPSSFPDHPALTATQRSTGHPNFNHRGYVPVARTFLRDAKVVLRRSPGTWWNSTRRAWQIHFLPIHDYTFFHARRRQAGEPMRAIERCYEYAAGSFAFAEWSWEREMPPFAERPGWIWAGACGIALLFAIAVAIRERRARARAALLLYCVFTILFVACVGNSFEVGENNRFRFLSEPLAWMLVCFVIDRALRRLRRIVRR